MFAHLFVISFSCIVALTAATFDSDMGTTALYHSENAYCSPETYLTRTYTGKLAGFVPVYSVNDTAHDTQGYVGYTSSQSTIFVVFRGSESIKNWASNIDAILTDYPVCEGCSVHKGWYSAEQNSIDTIISEVKALKEKFPSYDIVVTGHSLGAALSTLTSVDLMKAGLGPIRTFTFGSPRVGNQEFSDWYSSTMENFSRVTHHKDLVVHSPMHERFTHVSHEFYEPDDSVPVVLKECSGAEDPDCSYQWHITSIDDHLWYMGLVMGAGGCDAIL